MLILVMWVLRVDFSEFSLHNIQLAEMIFLFELVSELLDLFFLELLLVELFFSKTSYDLHFFFVIFTFPVWHLCLHSLMLFSLLRQHFKFLFQLLKVDFWVIFSELFHLLFLFLLFTLFLSALLHGFFLINLHTLKF